jgi:hypothetical protein
MAPASSIGRLIRYYSSVLEQQQIVLIEQYIGTAQNIIKLFVAAALYRKLLKVHLIFGHYNTAA